MTRLAPRAVVGRVRQDARTGLPVIALVGMTAAFLSCHCKGSAQLFALPMGLALHFISEIKRCADRIRFALKDVMQFGGRPVGLLVTFESIRPSAGRLMATH